MSNTVDLLQIKIERAKEKLPEDTSNAIAAVDWRAVILGMRTSKGYDFEQLGNLELETELILCGLLNSADYPKELQNRMRISKAETNELVEEMNNLVFKKIKEELIKNSERKKIFTDKSNTTITKEIMTDPVKSPYEMKINKIDKDILKSAGIEVVPVHNAPSIPTQNAMQRDAGWTDASGKPSSNNEKIHPILMQKLSGSFQIPTIKTEHTLDNISKNPNTPVKPITPETSSTSGYKKDPYRLSPED